MCPPRKWCVFLLQHPHRTRIHVCWQAAHRLSRQFALLRTDPLAREVFPPHAELKPALTPLPHPPALPSGLLPLPQGSLAEIRGCWLGTLRLFHSRPDKYLSA